MMCRGEVMSWRYMGGGNHMMGRGDIMSVGVMGGGSVMGS